MKVRLIAKNEMKDINNLIRVRFGLRYTISNGSVITEADGESYYIAFREFHEATNLTTAKKVGELVKKHLNAKEVYNYGVKIA